MSETSYWDRVTRERIGRRRLLKSGAALSMGAAALALVGCGDDDDDDGGGGGGGGAVASPTTAAAGPTQPPPAAGPEKGGTLRQSNVGAGADSSLNPITQNRAGHLLAGNHVYDHPISTRVGEKAPYILEAAESVETPDDLTVIIKLQPGMVYHDVPPVSGREVKASDIAVQQILVRDTSTANNSFQTQSMDTIEATDDLTVVYHLKAPNAYLFTGTQLGEIANMGIMPEETLDQLDTLQPIGSGPWQQVAGELGVKFEYKRFDKFRLADKIMMDGRSWTLFGDRVAEEAAFTAGQTDWHQPDPSSPSADTLIKQLGDKIYVTPYPTTAPFTVNIGGSKAYNKLKADVRAREAVYRSLDRQQFIDLIFNGKATLPPGMLTEALTAYQLEASQTAEFFKRDLTQARQLFEAAEVLDQEWEIMYFAPNAISDQTCQVFQSQLAEAGLKTIIAGIPTSEGFVKATAGEWHLFAGGHPAYSSPQIIMRQQHTKSGSRFGYTGLEDPDIDALVEQSEQATDFEENVRLVKQVQLESLKKYTGYILLCSRTIELLLYSKVQNWEVDPSETYFPRIDAWIKA